MICKPLKDGIEDLKHSIRLHLAISGGTPTIELGNIAIKLIDVMEDDDIKRAREELHLMAFNLVLNMVRIAATRLRSIDADAGNTYLKMISRELELKKPKVEFLEILQMVFDDLRQKTGDNYPRVTLLDGRPVPSRPGY
jgi:hypothetical protein